MNRKRQKNKEKRKKKKQKKMSSNQELALKRKLEWGIHKGEGANADTLGVSAWRLNRIEQRKKRESEGERTKRRKSFFSRQDEQFKAEEARRLTIRRRPKDEPE